MMKDVIIRDEDIVSRVVKRDRQVGADKAVDDKKEEYLEEEVYIDSENDPCAVEEVVDDYVVLEEEEEMDFDEVFETVKSMIADLTTHDKEMEEKVLDALRSGKLK